MSEGMPDQPPAALARLRRLRPELSGSLARTADLLLAQPQRSVQGTIEEFAAAAGTSVGSVSRLCRRLGVDGFRDLRIAVTAEVAGAPRGIWDTDLGRNFEPTDPLPDIARTLAAAQSRALHVTLDGLAAAGAAGAVESAATAISRATTVDLFGVSGSAVMAAELDLRLHRIGVSSRVYSDEHEGVTAASLLGSGDVAIAISRSGITVPTLRMLQIAADRGATTIAITGDPRSPIGRAASHVLHVVTEETTFLGGPLASRHAELAAIELLYVAVCRVDPERTARALAQTASAIAGLTAGLAAAGHQRSGSRPSRPALTRRRTK